jgi:hypothetical protein
MSNKCLKDNEPLVITWFLTRFQVHRIFVDHGSSKDIMFWSLFDKFGLGSKDLIPHKGILIGFTGKTIKLKGYVDMKLTLGKKPNHRTIPIRFLVVDDPSAYNALGRLLQLFKWR